MVIFTISNVTIFLTDLGFSDLPDIYSYQVGKPLKLQLGHPRMLLSLIKPMLMKFFYMFWKLKQVGFLVAGWQAALIQLWDSLKLYTRE